METKIYYSIFSGIVYEVCADEVAVLDDGQVPLTAMPSKSCRKCYGRGFVTHDVKRGIYNACNCLRKHVDPNYKPKEIQVPIEKFA